jgi:hypothetical protein
MQWMGIWNHQQPVTIALVDPDFDSRRLKTWITLLGYKPYHYAVVEAPYPSKAACTSMRSTYNVFEHFICSGWAYGTISNPLPSSLLTQILTVVG